MTRSTSRPAADASTTRRERREAARREQRRAPRPARSSARRPAWRSPLVLLTIGALCVGLIGIAALQMLPGNGAAAGGGTSAADEVMVPSDVPPADLVSDRSIGRADAPVTLTVWSDFQCPACRMLAQAVEPRLIREYFATGKEKMLRAAE